MRIGIAGNYGNDNQGDESVLEGVIVQVENTFQIDRRNIIVFTNNLEQTRQRYGTDVAPLYIDRGSDPMKFIRTLRHNRPIVASLDLMIIGGGGILMDLYRSNPFVFGIYGMLVRWTKTPAAVFGAGVGPIDTLIGKLFIRMIANSVRINMVRDKKSKQLLEDIGVKPPVHNIMDPAFYIPSQEKQTVGTKPLKIGVTALPYYHGSYWPTEDMDKYNAYIQGMAANLDHILEQQPQAMVQFFSTKHPYDTNATKDIRDLMVYQDRTNVCDQMLTHREIIDLIGEQDLVIGTRLHSLILSIIAKTPVIAVGYHNKVLDVMSSVGCRKNTLTIDHVSEDHQCIAQIYNDLYKNWEETVETFETMADRIRQESPDGMAQIRSLTEKDKI